MFNFAHIMTNDMKPELIIFDFDGTLADTASNILATFALTIAKLGLEPRSNAQCLATIGIPLRDGFKMLYPKAENTELDNYVRAYREQYFSDPANMVPKLYPGVVETLDEIQRQGIEMAVASSRTKQSLLEFCKATDISKYFAMILGCDDVTHAKPNPEPALTIIKALGKKADSSVMVGDMPVDIEMGRRAGCITVGAEYGNSSDTALEKAGADYIIDHMPTLLPALGVAE